MGCVRVWRVCGVCEGVEDVWGVCEGVEDVRVVHGETWYSVEREAFSSTEHCCLCCRNVLASASADCSVCVWNLQERKTLLLLPHPDKVTPLTCTQFNLT